MSVVHHARAVGLVLLVLGGCTRGGTRPLPRPMPVDATVPETSIQRLDVPRSESGRSDAGSPARARMPAGWRRMPRVVLAGATLRGTWDDAPDLDQDGQPDRLVAVEAREGPVRCLPSDPDHPCPTLPAPGDGDELLVAFVARLSTEEPYGLDRPRDGTADADTPQTGRLIGLRRIGPVPASTRFEGFEFAEFGPGVMARAILVSAGGEGTSDTLDVVDLFVGAALERYVGAVLQHCTRRPTSAGRTGAIAVSVPALTPLVWRAALAHPFSGCPARAEVFDASLAGPTSRSPIRKARFMSSSAAPTLRPG